MANLSLLGSHIIFTILSVMLLFSIIGESLEGKMRILHRPKFHELPQTALMPKLYEGFVLCGKILTKQRSGHFILCLQKMGHCVHRFLFLRMTFCNLHEFHLTLVPLCMAWECKFYLMKILFLGKAVLPELI
jgi:hypothetical protein